MGKLGRTHDRILEAYGQILAGVPADAALKATFKRARDLGPGERQTVSDTVYGLIRNARRISDLLERAVKAEGRTIDTIEPPMRARMLLLAFFAAERLPIEQIEARDTYAFRKVPGAIARIFTGRIPPAKRSAIEELAIDVSMPTWVIERLAARFGQERASEIARALNLRAPITVRVNALKATREEAARAIEAELGVRAEPTSGAPLGLILSGPSDVQGSKVFERGLIEIQDEGSQRIALATGASPKESVLDACAGAGGKTLALAAMMSNTGRLLALDPEDKKLEVLKRRARRAGVTNTETVRSDLEALDRRLFGTFDRVLVDAPCTGTGVLRRHPDVRDRITPKDLAKHVDRQRRLITGALNALKPGGTLVYATCSVLFEENEGIVEDVVKTEPRLALIRDERIGPGPSERDPDGFYYAIMRRH